MHSPIYHSNIGKYTLSFPLQSSLLVSVCLRGDGKVWGKVLVYKNPGKHPGDVHLFDAVWDERLNPYVGLSQYTIFFSVQGDRPIVDEIANSDLDGDMYWVCENTEARYIPPYAFTLKYCCCYL